MPRPGIALTRSSPWRRNFNRGFTPFLWKERTKDITSFDTPKSLGEPVGTVKELKGNSFTIAGLKQLNNGDGLTFFNEKGELEGFRVNRVEANRIFTLDRPAIRPKMPLYRNFDQEFDKLLSKAIRRAGTLCPDGISKITPLASR